MANAAPYSIGDMMTPQEAKAALYAIVPQKFHIQMQFAADKCAEALVAIQESMPERLVHEVNRARGFAFTSNVDAGFSHQAG